jgi:hypothetical protein
VDVQAQRASAKKRSFSRQPGAKMSAKQLWQKGSPTHATPTIKQGVVPQRVHSSDKGSGRLGPLSSEASKEMS